MPCALPPRPPFVLLTELRHPRPGEGEVVLTGTAHDDVVQDTHPDVLQGLGDLVGGVNVLLAGVALSAWMIVDEDDTAGIVDAGLRTVLQRKLRGKRFLLPLTAAECEQPR